MADIKDSKNGDLEKAGTYRTGTGRPCNRCKSCSNLCVHIIRIS